MTVTAVSGCGFGSSALSSPSSSGPMRTPHEHGMMASGPVGSRFTDGLEVLLLEGDSPATIVSVRSVGQGQDGLRFLGAMVAGPTRELAAHSQLRNYPPGREDLGPIVAAEGAVVEPAVDGTPSERGLELLLGYEVVAEELAYRAAIEVVYDVDGEEFLWRSPGRLVYCPDDMTSDACQEAAEADGFGE